MHSASIATGKRRHSLEKSIAWWREARFGLFIHWGLYAIPAGFWEGKPVPSIGEWIMYHRKIPVATYEQLARQFHPTRFDAARWAQLAKDAGMRYVVITAKHHEGFAMYHSRADRYNVVDATPWHHDPIKDLARECRRRGIKFCVYYSQDIDWHHPDGATNTWDYDEKKKQPARYLREKVFPQLRELLTQYGPLGLIWFDTPISLSKPLCVRIRRFVKKLQPDCLVSGRLGHGLGDYSVPHDNFLPPGGLEGNWETCATLNNTWGFKRDDHAWKSAESLITTLVDVTSKGVNYLLNVGPDAKGVIPAPSVQRLRQIGAWLKVNGEAIYGTTSSPFRYELPWGRITTKGRTLYFHFFAKPGRHFRLHGLKSRVKSVSPLAAPTTRFSFAQSEEPMTRTPILAIDFKGFKTTKPVTVVAVTLADAPAVEPLTLQQPDDSLSLISLQARVGTDAAKPEMRVTASGLTENWSNSNDWLEWSFTVLKPGTYDVTVVTTHEHFQRWSGGHTLRLTCAGQTLRRVTRRDAVLPSLRSTYFPQIATRFGRLTFAQPGVHTLRLKADRMRLKAPEKGLFLSDGGIMFSEVRLVPAE